MLRAKTSEVRCGACGRSEASSRQARAGKFRQAEADNETSNAEREERPLMLKPECGSQLLRDDTGEDVLDHL